MAIKTEVVMCKVTRSPEGKITGLSPTSDKDGDVCKVLVSVKEEASSITLLDPSAVKMEPVKK